MKKLLTYAALLSASIILFSCGGGKKNDPAPEPVGESSWKLGSYTYTRGASAQTNKDGKAGMVVTTSGDGGNHGAYSGSALTIIFNNRGPGKYTLSTTAIMSANPTAALMALNCSIGTAVTTGSVLYSAPVNQSTTADVSIDAQGQYHVKISSPVNVVKKLILGGGIPGAPETTSLTIKDAF
ncbi:hypothetical protein [Pedobacter steynii]|uniref:Lipocalin-like domain-containing protein n=1 Tax=Pedobacter steynii TaxID=430522 RepID=A0A1D7QIK5_9SPHI|nr:hypothetical protein [Pedobacter steynii]AOM78439.1 hypothetical protein BFS30_15390 [Pedobacter steynii]